MGSRKTGMCHDRDADWLHIGADTTLSKNPQGQKRDRAPVQCSAAEGGVTKQQKAIAKVGFDPTTSGL